MILRNNEKATEKKLITLILALLVILAGLITFAGSYADGTGVPPLVSDEQNTSTSAATESAPPLMTDIAEKEDTLPSKSAQAARDTDLVRVLDYIPDVVLDIRYATDNNFTGQVIYDFSDAWLRYGTVKKLMQVHNALKAQGLCLKIWDAFRPTTAQFRFWSVCRILLMS